MAPVKSLPALLTCLGCNYWRTPCSKSLPIIDVKRLQSLSESALRSVCGRVFAQGDIVWTCRQCAKDPTCVQCDQCFRKADHIGHEVYFHRASGGGSGCCDCGDEEAWSRAGNCLDHNHPSCDHHGPTNPLEGFPPELEKGVRAVVKGAVGVLVSYIVCTVRGFAALPKNQFVDEMRVRAEPLVVRLHNDDVHTYDEVTAALRAFGLDARASEQITVKVDKEGEAVVMTTSAAQQGAGGAARLAAAHERFSAAAGLLVSMTPLSVVQLEPRMVAIFDWFQSMGALSDGLRRIVATELVAELDSAATCLPEVDASLSPEIAATLETLNQQFTARCAFNDVFQFPSVMQHLLRLPDSLELVAPVYKKQESDPTEVSEGTEESIHGPATDDFIERLRKPFRHCHRDALALLILASPYLSVGLKKSLNDLVIQFQHDLVFKATFSQQFTTLYPTLAMLYCRNVGTADRTVFHTSVQVYTANSVVTMLSSDGATGTTGTTVTALRLLREEGGHPLMVTPLLAATLQAVLLDAGCLPVRASPTATVAARAAFLEHHAIRTHRLSHMCRDLEYLCADASFCVRLLCEDVDKGLASFLYSTSTFTL